MTAATKTKDKYFEAVGRRKTATARVRVFGDSKNSVLINEKSLSDYFPQAVHQKNVLDPLKTGEDQGTFKITVKVKGGGISAQSEAIRHGIARALVLVDSENRKPLKKAGFLKRDPRSKERKKPGLKKARKAGQWSKR